MKQSSIDLKTPELYKKCFKQEGPLGLFYLFFSRCCLDNIRLWSLVDLGSLTNNTKAKCRPDMFNAYIGLEMAMSLIQMNSIEEFWQTKKFSGHPDFKNVMSWEHFQKIRSAIKLHPPTADRPKGDPLWHSRNISERVLKECSSIACPVGPVAFDESTIRTKARCLAKSFMPNKPQKYGIRLYLLCGWRYVYCYNFSPNGRGCSNKNSLAQNYLYHFPFMRHAFDRFFRRDKDDDDCPIEEDSASALWMLQISQLSYKSRKSNHVFTDSYYTRHLLARAIDEFTGGLVKMTGTFLVTSLLFYYGCVELQ